MTTVFVGKWCVYGHYVDGKCIYIGMGRPGRAFNNAPARSREWLALARDGYDVQILSWHETKAASLSREIALIREIKPTCNKMHNGWVPDAFKENWKIGRRKPRPFRERSHRGGQGGEGRIGVACSETGEVFESLSSAARKFGISVAAVSKGVQGNKSVAGHTFVRCADV